MIIGKINVRPTKHYVLFHSDVEWDLVILTILSPTKVLKNYRHGKNRYTYMKKFKKYIIEIHTKNDDVNEIVWVINAFKT